VIWECSSLKVAQEGPTEKAASEKRPKELEKGFPGKKL
jgi:hypothetical protein